MTRPRVLGLILAGGRGERLQPLTKERSKPSVPFGSKYRIVDFVLSSFVNSRIYSMYILVQYKSQSLIDHIRRVWRMSALLDEHFIVTVPPQMRWGESWYRGTADAVFQNLNLIRDVDPTRRTAIPDGCGRSATATCTAPGCRASRSGN